MKKSILLLLFVAFAANAQEGNFEKIKAHKTAFITQELDLSAKQAEKFWPIYNKHEAVVMALRKEEREEFRNKTKNGIDRLSDIEASSMIEKHISIKTEMNATLNSLIGELKGVITPQQTIKLLRAEEEFKKRLLKRFSQREGRGERGEKPRGQGRNK